ncbi:S-methyl-5-thioribose-1-phosphate isomerase [Mycobacterium gordonae]|uniref:Methylthioribose-1-phosphate isomerase n=1 Tax=Mycobacterium gordonae TaxID=1778 RepID=A0A1A6BNG0_MYCGO|nr:S-methyl-5-thioribose-1-phosphate isomerase [Mycobacterium gordonae]MBI2703102.1 S-methyl-5-thioribose-1-phosphate isomerase [Mycobacterium sp.]MCV7006717.1 S-methyl-5-thioribose-1-phosphate isomerase [Mycobacterium gordonae]OBS03739.1 S-methyl-5-thioribose-1-phosphate isomerase [Mycobacterium gordonae]ODR20515.1 S-methyl-5-thioribose-1-phosphate isomerase [Mycobacterium gordonae]ORV82123.1 initiation factor 2B subunit alpha [Mycobacterium gordonae]
MRRTIDWDGDAVTIIDQTALPAEYRILRLRTVDELIDAITRLAVRGAPALGGAGALGVVLATRAGGDVRASADRVAQARPTAVNLSWGVARALEKLDEGAEAVLAEALSILDEDERLNRAASGHAAEIVLGLCDRRPLRLLSHCNAGHLATVAWGSALGVVWHLHQRGLVESVLVDETRPLLQGSRLTAWELAQAGVPYRVQPDGAAAAAMARGVVDCVLVGADRIAANGDVANKIGTYGLAIAARHHHVPLVVVAPSSTIDKSLASGADIAIEERAPEELRSYAGVTITPPGADVFNPAFDVTPAQLITAVVTEHGRFSP